MLLPNLLFHQEIVRVKIQRTKIEGTWTNLALDVLTDGFGPKDDSLQLKMTRCRYVDLIHFLLVKLPGSLVMRINNTEPTSIIIIAICATPTRTYANWFLWRMKPLFNSKSRIVAVFLVHIYINICIESGLWTSITLLKCTNAFWPFIYMISVALIYLPLVIPDIFMTSPRTNTVWYILGWIFIVGTPCVLYLSTILTTSCFENLKQRDYKSNVIYVNSKIFPFVCIGLQAVLLPLWCFFRFRRNHPSDNQTRPEFSELNTGPTLSLDTNIGKHSAFFKRVDLGAVFSLILFWVDIYTSMGASLLFFQDGKYLWSAALFFLLVCGGSATAFEGLKCASTQLKLLWPNHQNKTILAHLLFQSYPIYLCETMALKWKKQDQRHLSKIISKLELHWTFFQRQ